jgi:hypothetical protein
LETGALPIELQPYARNEGTLSARLLVNSVRPAPATILLELDAVRVVLLVLVSVIVATLAFLASERDELTHVVFLSTRST